MEVGRVFGDLGRKSVEEHSVLRLEGVGFRASGQG